MKKIIGLAIATIMIIAAVGGATWATFSDTETSTGNTLSAGTLDLNIEGSNAAVQTFTASDVAPGSGGSGDSALQNVGSLTGKLSVTTSAASGTAGTNNGDPQIVPTNSLYTETTMDMYIDLNSNSSWDAGDIGLMANGNSYNYAAAGANNLATGTATVVNNAVTSIAVNVAGSGYVNATDVVSITGGGGSGAMARANISGGVVQSFTVLSGGSGYTSLPTVVVLEYNVQQVATMNSYSSKTWDSLLTLAQNGTANFHVDWLLPTSAGNEVQGGTATIDFTFTLNQQ